MFYHLLDDKIIKKDENRIDTFFLFGGTNDSWANSPLGDRLTSDWKDADLYNVFPAFSYLSICWFQNYQKQRFIVFLMTN